MKEKCLYQDFDEDGKSMILSRYHQESDYKNGYCGTCGDSNKVVSPAPKKKPKKS